MWTDTRHHILAKYSLLNYLKRYIFSGIFPSKSLWKNLVNYAIKYEEGQKNDCEMTGTFLDSPS